GAARVPDRGTAPAGRPRRVGRTARRTRTLEPIGLIPRIRAPFAGRCQSADRADLLQLRAHVPLVTVQELIDAGVHFGHQASRWNPKMKPFIRGKRHRIHVIDLEETVRGLYRACHFIRHIAATGAQIMFLGTKRQIRAVVLAEAQRCGMPAVTERWIGGTLTNFATVRERLSRLEELEAMEASGVMEKFKKKDQASLRREMGKIRRNLEGVRQLYGLPGALVVVDPRREDNSIREARRMNVPVVAILDTDCDPASADIAI